MHSARCIRHFLLFILVVKCSCRAHDAKDFDDTVLYKIEFDVPDFDKSPDLKNHVRTFYTQDHEKYECVIPNVQKPRDEEENINSNINLAILMTPFFTKPSCSYRVEAYWSYEICHFNHVRQYHEEREGTDSSFEDYYLGKMNAEDLKKLEKEWEEKKKSGKNKLKTVKIDNINYPYVEVVMTRGTTCDITNAPRTTVLKYVCYFHGKNDIYSFKETSSCNYEAIILSSSLCTFTVLHPEEYKEIPIKCYNSLTKPNKPLNMLRQELADMQFPFSDFPIVEADGHSTALPPTVNDDQQPILNNLIKKESLGFTSQQEGSSEENSAVKQSTSTSAVSDISPLLEFIKGKSCLTGGSGWWKYEFCYGNYVRQFHKNKKSETELFLGNFDANAHREWLEMNPDKRPQKQSSSIWHHYEKGTKCDRTGLPREVDVKLTCSGLGSMNPTAVSMYLLEPKTCQYILVFESPMVCKIMFYIDENGLIDQEKLLKILEDQRNTDKTAATNEGSTEKNKETSIEASVSIDVRL